MSCSWRSTVGRRPATADLDLDLVGLQPSRYVEVDNRFRAVGWMVAGCMRSVTATGGRC